MFSLLAVHASAQQQNYPGGSGGSGGFVYTGLLAGIPATCTIGQVAFITDATPGQNQYNCTATNTWTQNLNSGSGGASTALDNLSAVNINSSLLSQTGVALGSNAKSFSNLFLHGTGTYGTNSFEFTGDPTGVRVLTLPDLTDTLAGAASTTTFTNKTYDTAGTGNAFSINGTSITAVSGTGSVCLTTSCVMTTPNLGTPSAINISNATSPPTWNQNTTGSAAKWTTARNLAGNSVDGSANVAFSNKFIVQGTTDAGLSGAQFLGALGTGIVYNTTSTGILSIASAANILSACTGCAPLASPTFTGTVTTAPAINVPSGATLTIQSGGTLTCAGGSTCPSSGTGISGLTSGYVPLAGSATTITGDAHIDDGVTTAATLTATEPFTVNTGAGSSALTLGASGNAGTVVEYPASGNFTTTWGSAATASNTILGFTAVPTNGHIITCTVSSTTCTLTDGGAAGTGTVTSIATTSPITGGTITTTGTIACATCVTSAASLTSTALMTGGGSQASQTPSATATLNSSGNMSLPGTLAVTGHDTFEGVTSTGATGTGNFVFATSPTLTTPVIGVATGTSLAATSFLSTGTAPTCSAGTGGVWCAGEGSAATGASSVDVVYAQATNHCLDQVLNNVDIGCLVAEPAGLVSIQTISGADYTNTSVTPSTVFSWTLPVTAAAKNYKYTCDIMWASTSTTLVGPVFGINMSAAPTQTTAAAAVQNTLAGADINGYLSNTTTGSQTLVTSSAAGVTNTNYWAKIWGTIEGAPTAGSTFIINAASTSGTTAILDIRRGSGCKLEVIQ